MKLVGGRRYTIDREEATKGKLYFMRASNNDLEKLKSKLISGKKDHVKKWQDISFEDKQAVVDALIKVIKVANGNIEITWKI